MKIQGVIRIIGVGLKNVPNYTPHTCERGVFHPEEESCGGAAGQPRDLTNPIFKRDDDWLIGGSRPCLALLGYPEKVLTFTSSHVWGVCFGTFFKQTSVFPATG